MLGPAGGEACSRRFSRVRVQVIAGAARRRPALEATARRLAGRSLGVVLSGGGARALAHLGVLEELSLCRPAASTGWAVSAWAHS